MPVRREGTVFPPVAPAGPPLHLPKLAVTQSTESARHCRSLLAFGVWNLASFDGGCVYRECGSHFWIFKFFPSFEFLFFLSFVQIALIR